MDASHGAVLLPFSRRSFIELLRQVVELLLRAVNVLLGEQLMPHGKAQQHIVGVEHPPCARFIQPDQVTAGANQPGFFPPEPNVL